MKHDHINSSLSGLIETHTGVKSARCYQCGKCSAGCPMAQDMDITPSSLMRMLQVEDDGFDAKILKSETIWLCLTCETCVSRCPMSVDIPKVMDFVREKALNEGVQNPQSDKNIVNFHQSFMDMVKNTGRSYEIGLVVDYKLRSKKFLQDIRLVPGMLKRGKLPLLPDTLYGLKEISTIFRKTNGTK